MKQRVFLTLMMSFLFFKGVSAQETNTTVSTAQNENKTSYWTSSEINNEPVLNPNKFRDNWFITVNAGTYLHWGDNCGSAKGKNFQPAAGFSVGKWISPWGGIRLMGMYGRGFGQTYKPKLDRTYNWNIVNGYVDALFNLHNLFGGYKENRFFQAMAIIGIGAEHNFGFGNKSWYKDYPIDTDDNTLLGFRAGMLASFRLNKALSLNIEASVNCLDDSYDGQIWDDKWDGHVNLLVGLVYRFKNHDGTHQFTYARRDMSKYDAMNDEINRLRKEAAEMKAAPEVTVKRELIESKRVSTLVSFDTNSTEVNKLQEVNVYTAAEGLKKIENGDLYITPIKNNEMSSDLFNGRANAIRDMLVKEYNVPAGHIFIEENNELVRSLDPAKNCVIIYIVK